MLFIQYKTMQKTKSANYGPKKRKVMGLVIELLVWLTIEVVFWGIMFWTGYVLAITLTLGQWTPGRIESAKETKKENRRETKFIVTALIGALFWICFWIAIIIIFMKSP